MLPVSEKIYLGIIAHKLRDGQYSVKIEILSDAFTKGRKTVGNIFIIKTSVDKYLRSNRGRLYWCFVGFEKASYCSNRVVLWFKTSKMGVSENIGNCIKIMYQDTKFCVKCGEHLISIYLSN